MSRASLVWIPLGLLMIAAGCTMCASPYDECGPTVGGGCPQQCWSNARAGSILSGQPAYDGQPTMAAESAQLGNSGRVPGKVLSVTDRKAEQSAQGTPSAGASLSPETGGWRSTGTTKTPSQLAPTPER